MNPSNFKSLLLLPLAAFALAGCSDDDDDDRAPAQGYLQIYHLAPDAPDVAIGANGSRLVENLAFGAATAQLAVAPGDYAVTVDGKLPDGTTTTVIGPADLTISADTETNVLAVNNLAAIEPLVITQPKVAVASDQVEVTVVHASAAAPAVDVYVTAPDAPLDAAAGTLNFKESLGPVMLPAAAYRIRVTLAGTETLVFDSGETGISLTGGESLLVAAIPNTGLGEAPIKLLVANDAEPTVVSAAGTPAGLKVVHAAPPVGDAEVFVSSASLGLNEVELVDSIAYAAVVPAADQRVEVDPASDYRVQVAQDGQGAANALIDVAPVPLTADMAYTAIATGGVNGFDPTLLLAVDQTRSVATEARVRVIHAAPAAGTVDVFVTPAGTVSSAEILSGEVAPTLDEFAVNRVTDYLSLTPGDYDIRVVAGGNLLAIDTQATLAAGLIANVIARGPDAVDSDPADFGLILTTN